MDFVEIAKKIVLEKSKVKPLPKDCRLSDLGIDSLDAVEIVVKIEDETKLSFTTEEIADCVTLNDLFSLIKKKSS